MTNIFQEMAPTEPLPKFEAPPVVEMVIGVEFAPLSKWSIPYFGLFWALIRNDYPRCVPQLPLTSNLESFREREQQLTLTIPLGAPPPSRCWYMDNEETWLIQVQHDRFVQNWRKAPADDEYSRYGHVCQRFQTEFERFTTFLSVESLGTLDVKQCEVTYVNHIDPIEGEGPLAAVAELFPNVSRSVPPAFLPSSPENAAFTTSYVIGELQGRLRMVVQPVFRHEDAQDTLQMTVTAKVRPENSGVDAILGALDLGHEWAVRSFADSTSARLHEKWKRRQ